jgi:hypothetical protein
MFCCDYFEIKLKQATIYRLEDGLRKEHESTTRAEGAIHYPYFSRREAVACLPQTYSNPTANVLLNYLLRIVVVGLL